VSARRATFGLTWWGQRWIAALEALGAVYANRLPRGRAYARAGRVVDVTVGAGTVTARVQGSRARPYRVTLRLPPFDDAVWEHAVEALAGELRHAAALLDGRMPEDGDDILGSCGVSLFPRHRPGPAPRRPQRPAPPPPRRRHHHPHRPRQEHPLRGLMAAAAPTSWTPSDTERDGHQAARLPGLAAGRGQAASLARPAWEASVAVRRASRRLRRTAAPACSAR